MKTTEEISFILALLIASGSMCADCAHGTRTISKNVAVCTKCGKRLRRCQISDVKVTHEPCRVIMAPLPS